MRRKKQKNNYYRRKKMARTSNERERDTQIINALDAVLRELKNLNKNLDKLIPSKKGR